MQVIEIFTQLEEVAEKLPTGIAKGDIPCVKTAIDLKTNAFINAYTGNNPMKLLPAINEMVDLYKLITGATDIKVEVSIHPEHQKFAKVMEVIGDKLPDNIPGIYDGEEIPCIKTALKELLKYYYNDLAYNIYTGNYYDRFRDIYRALGYKPNGKPIK